MGKVIFETFSIQVKAAGVTPIQKYQNFFQAMKSVVTDEDLFYQTSLYLEPRNNESRPKPTSLINEKEVQLTPADSKKNQLVGGNQRLCWVALLGEIMMIHLGVVLGR